MTKDDVVIVIPTQKEKLESYEIISLEQVCKILNRFRIVLAVPEDIKRLDEVITSHNIDVEYFASSYFSSIEAYSQFCLSEDLYERFSNYEYMLLYQLDAFVFSDRLLEFCNVGYDYIGAPTPKCLWSELDTQIGNGGFSLRKISTMRNIVNLKELILEEIKQSKNESEQRQLIKNEDKFIAYALGFLEKNGKDISIPTLSKAFEFSIEFNINNIYENIEDKLPFGTHRWHHYKFDIWWNIIEKYGYILTEEEKRLLRRGSADKSFNLRVFLKKIMDEDCGIMTNFFDEIAPEKKVSVWGLGEDFINILPLFQKEHITIVNMYDKKAGRIRTDILEPTFENINKEKYPIIITSSKYTNEIADRLLAYSKQEKKDFYKAVDFNQYLNNYYDIEKYGEY